MTTPFSVFKLAERGSILKEPMNRVSLSTAMVLACKLEPELPVKPRSLKMTGLFTVGLSSYKLMPARKSGLRYLA